MCYFLCRFNIYNQVLKFTHLCEITTLLQDFFLVDCGPHQTEILGNLQRRSEKEREQTTVILLLLLKIFQVTNKGTEYQNTNPAMSRNLENVVNKWEDFVGS